LHANGHRDQVNKAVAAVFLLVSATLALSSFGYLPLVTQRPVHAASPSQDWTSFIFDNNNSRYQASSTVTSANVNTLTLKWMFATDYSVTSTPLVENGVVYFADWDGNVYAVNLANGNLVWKTNVGFPISSTPMLANGLLYVGGGPNGPTEVLALDQTNGNIVWTYTFHSTMDAIWASPIVFNGRLYIGLASTGSAADESNSALLGEIDALDAATGSFLWKFQTMVGTSGGSSIWGSIVPDPNLNAIYFGTGNAFSNTPSSLYAYSIISLNAATGALNWYYQAYPSEATGQDLDFGSTPNLFSLQYGGQTYSAIGLGGKDGIYYVLDRTNGKLIVEYQVGVVPPVGQPSNGIIGLPGFIYPSTPKVDPEVFIPTQGANDQGLLAALFPASGTYAWKDTTASYLLGSVAIAPGVVFAGDGGGYLYAVSSVDGSILYKTRVFGALVGGITVAEGCVLFGNYAYPTVDSRLGVYVFAPATPVTSTSSTSTTSTSSTSSTTTTSSSTSNTYGVVSASWGYAPTSIALGTFAQWQGKVTTTPTKSGSGIPIVWYLDGNPVYSTTTGGGCCGPNSGASYYGTTLSGGSHTLYFVVGGVASSVLSICSGSCTTTTTTTTVSSSSTSTSSSSTTSSTTTTSTTSTTVSTSSGNGVVSVSWGYAPTAVKAGAYAQWQAQVFTSSGTSASGTPVTWYLDGVAVYSTTTGSGCCGADSGASYFGASLSAGSHTLYFVAGGLKSTVLNVVAS